MHGYIRWLCDAVSCGNTGSRVRVYYATSRCLYNRLLLDYALPSERTMRNLTSKASKLDDYEYIRRTFLNLDDERQRTCVIKIDEVYVKASLTYHGGVVFGSAQNRPDELANTMLVLMVHCLFGGPQLVGKAIPVKKLNSKFQYDQTQLLLQAIRDSGGTVAAIVTDDYRVNQQFFKKFKTQRNKPWQTTDNTFLLFDYVHLLKNVRNNWLTEENGELDFVFDNKRCTARWSDLVELRNWSRTK